MQIVIVDLKRSHYGATADEVCEAFNVDRGVPSSLLGMAVHPEHRPTVEEYLGVVGWKLENTEGEAHARWQSVAEHLHIVLKASAIKHRENVKKAAA
ncbi:MAG TPA: hypothetical protein VM619_02520 [Luteimonas sp.]|nr:hypothetical protein [Luteimonas sp.]